MRSFLQTSGFRIEDIEIKKSTVTAHVKDMVNGMTHFGGAVTMMVAQSWILEECERLTVELIKGFGYQTAKPAQFDLEVLMAITWK